MERYLRVNLLGPGPGLMKKEFTGPQSHKGWETLVYLTFNKYRGFFSALERPEHEGDGLSPSNAEVKNEWSFTSTRPYVFMLWTETALTSSCKLDLPECWYNETEHFSAR